MAIAGRPRLFVIYMNNRGVENDGLRSRRVGRMRADRRRSEDADVQTGSSIGIGQLVGTDPNCRISSYLLSYFDHL